MSEIKEREKCQDCWICLEGVELPFGGVPVLAVRMVVCTVCGNKRCPKASDHELQCTNSNESGQEGSVYT